MKIKLFYIHPDNYGNLMMASAFIQNFSNLCLAHRGDNKNKPYPGDLSSHSEGKVETNALSTIDFMSAEDAAKDAADMLHKSGKRYEEPEFYVDVLDERELERVRQSVPAGTRVFREALFDRSRRGISGKLEKLAFLPKEILYNCKNYDICVALGGDCISQYYSWQVFASDMIKFRFISRKKPFYLLGQTMGPFSRLGVGLVRSCLKNCSIYVRDHDCLEYMKKTFSFTNLQESKDLAFLDIPYQDTPYQNAKGHKSKVMEELASFGEYVTVVASGAHRQYTPDTNRYVAEYVDIIKYIIDNTKFAVLLLAHVIHVEDSNDKKVIELIRKEMPEKYVNRIHMIDRLILPYEARILLGNGKLTITGRMHAAVSSINMGVIPICLSYSVKFKGVIGDDFELNDLILQCRGAAEWEEGNVSRAVTDMLEYCLKNRENILKSLTGKRAEIQERAWKQIYDVFYEANSIQEVRR